MNSLSISLCYSLYIWGRVVAEIESFGLCSINSRCLINGRSTAFSLTRPQILSKKKERNRVGLTQGNLNLFVPSVSVVGKWERRGKKRVKAVWGRGREKRTILTFHINSILSTLLCQGRIIICSHLTNGETGSERSNRLVQILFCDLKAWEKPRIFPPQDAASSMVGRCRGEKILSWWQMLTLGPAGSTSVTWEPNSAHTLYFR